MVVDKYDLFYIDNYSDIESLNRDSQYDLFISAYNNESMVQDLFEHINATQKIWIVLPDYKDIEINNIQGDFFQSHDINFLTSDIESTLINQFLNEMGIANYNDKKICIDITGFVKPYMIYLILALEFLHFKDIHIIYSEPKSYVNHEETEFSEEEIIETRSIRWDDIRPSEGRDDLFIINAGYDHKLIRNIAGYKKSIKTRKILLGYPSLQPVMYQENLLNLQKASDELNLKADFTPLFAPANDPFETAYIINQYIEEYRKKNNDLKTIYLAPLATKPQTLGMILFYIYEKQRLVALGINTTIIYPFTSSYSSSSGKELFKINRYILEF